MSKYLPEGFGVPNNRDYNDAIASLHADVTEEGGAQYFLPVIRLTRRNWAGYNMNFLRAAARDALASETIKPPDLDYAADPTRPQRLIIKDPDHKRANAIMSGMVMGQILAESLYPIKFPFKYMPYREFRVLQPMLGDRQATYEAAHGLDTIDGIRIGREAMADSQLRVLSEQSLQNINQWAADLISNPALRALHALGVGSALFQAWDWATDRLDEEGVDISLNIEQDSTVE